MKRSARCPPRPCPPAGRRIPATHRGVELAFPCLPCPEAVGDLRHPQRPPGGKQDVQQDLEAGRGQARAMIRTVPPQGDEPRSSDADLHRSAALASAAPPSETRSADRDSPPSFPPPSTLRLRSRPRPRRCPARSMRGRMVSSAAGRHRSPRRIRRWWEHPLDAGGGQAAPPDPPDATEPRIGRRDLADTGGGAVRAVVIDEDGFPGDPGHAASSRATWARHSRIRCSRGSLRQGVARDGRHGAASCAGGRRGKRRRRQAGRVRPAENPAARPDRASPPSAPAIRPKRPARQRPSRALAAATPVREDIRAGCTVEWPQSRTRLRVPAASAGGRAYRALEWEAGAQAVSMTERPRPVS